MVLFRVRLRLCPKPLFITNTKVYIPLATAPGYSFFYIKVPTPHKIITLKPVHPFGCSMEAQLATEDEPYFTGIWYNGEIGEFEKYRLWDGEIQILSPDESIVLDTVEYLETGNLIKVKEQAVSNPVKFYQNIVYDLIASIDQEITYMTYQDEISFRYVREHTKIVEAEE